MSYHYDPAELFPVLHDLNQILFRVLGEKASPELLAKIEARRGIRSDEQPDDHGLRLPNGATISTMPP
jgi:hypothetical protein